MEKYRNPRATEGESICKLSLINHILKNAKTRQDKTRQDKYFIKPKTSVQNDVIMKRMLTTDDWQVNWHNAYKKYIY